MSGRVIASVPDSPQQRSDNGTSPPIRLFTTVSGLAVLIGVWQGSWYRYRTPVTPSTFTPFSSRYSWMSSSRAPGKIRPNSYFSSWSRQVPHDTITVRMSR